MSKNQGYAKMPREVVLDPYVLRHKFLLKVLAYFYARAQHKPRTVFNAKGMPIHLKSGELHVPIRDMAQELGIPRETLNRHIMGQEQGKYWDVVKSRAGNKIRLKIGYFGTNTGTREKENTGIRSNRVLSTKVSNRSEGQAHELSELNIPTEQKDVSQPSALRQHDMEYPQFVAKQLEVYENELDVIEEYGRAVEKANRTNKVCDESYFASWLWNEHSKSNQGGFQKKKSVDDSVNGNGSGTCPGTIVIGDPPVGMFPSYERETTA